MARIGVDIGGTFTDIVIETGADRFIHKLLTTPHEPERAVIDGIDACLAKAGLSAKAVELIVHGTTLVTNAVIERKGAKTALIATQGFRDTIEIADEGRFDQYDLNLQKPAPLIPRQHRHTVPERVSATGEVLLELDENAVRALVAQLGRDSIQSVAIALMHAYANPDHEERIAAILRRELPGLAISLSSAVCPEIREYERTSTTVVNAYVQPLMEGYLKRLETKLHVAGMTCPVLLMASGGSLVTLATAKAYPVRMIESGPAGGAILAAELAKSLGLDKVLSFDMGGTTAKICLIQDGQPQSARSFEVDRSARFMKGSGFPLRIPVIEMVEIGAGGGSLATIDALGRIQVGPESAGADPGPIAYGQGGTVPAITDADLVLGKLDPEGFAGGSMTLDKAGAEQAIEQQIGEALSLTGLMAAAAITEVVDENMSNAARVHAVESGVDVAGFTIIAFGGAAPLHATRVAEKLGISRIVIPANAGVGSAVGFLSAPVAFEQVRSLYQRLANPDLDAANALLAAMTEEATIIVRQGADDAELVTTMSAYMRYVGQGHEIAVELPGLALEKGDLEGLRERFEAAYQRLFERIIPGGEIEILTWAVRVLAPRELPTVVPSQGGGQSPQPIKERLLDRLGQGQTMVPVYARSDFAPGSRISGPALIEEDTTTTVIGHDFAAQLDAVGNLILERTGDQA